MFLFPEEQKKTNLSGKVIIWNWKKKSIDFVTTFRRLLKTIRKKLVLLALVLTLCPLSRPYQWTQNHRFSLASGKQRKKTGRYKPSHLALNNWWKKRNLFFLAFAYSSIIRNSIIFSLKNAINFFDLNNFSAHFEVMGSYHFILMQTYLT